ncbi:MAG: Rid family detoxifying hydrolase [Actinomycetota bacterium]|nr:Rid family detoxifying hydrolase [Actinomycetota bacterium]
MRHVTSPKAPGVGGPYSHAVVSNGLAFLAGQRPVDAETGAIADGVEEQARQVLCNLGIVLEELGLGFADVVRTNVYLNDIGAFDAVNRVYREFFSEPFPARTTVAVQLRGILVEIDAIAELAETASAD